MSSGGKHEQAGMIGRAAGVAEGLARSGWRLSIMPALALPQPVRSPLFDALRWWADGASRILPEPFGGTANGFVADLDDLEGRAARREDLGRRLRRERRRADREA